MAEVEFIAERDGQPCHEYWLNKVRIPSVSEIIRPCVCYDGIKKSVMDNAREFGLDVDAACQYYDEDDLDEDSLDERVRLRLEGWKLFRKEFDFKPLVIAQPTAHIMNGMPYGMTADRYGTGRFDKIGYAVVDIKNTAEIEPHHGLQLAGYEDHYSDGGKLACARIIVQLKDKGYNIVEFKDRQDKNIFGALLAIAHWKIQKKIKG